MRIARPLGFAAVGVVALSVGVAGIAVGARPWTSRSSPAAGEVRSFAESGVSVRVPDGWRVGREEGNPESIVELEHRPVFGLFAIRGMWVSRWPDGRAEASLGAWADGEGDGATIAGREAVHRVERVGPSIVHRLPAAVTTHRSRYRFVAYDRVYEVGFWGPASSIGDAQERWLLSGIGVEAPAPIELAGDGWSLSVPPTWVRGTECDEWVACAFAPVRDDVPPRAWSYVMERKGSDLGAATDDLLALLRKGEPLDVRSEPGTVADREATIVRFGYPEQGGEVDQIEELLVPIGPQRFLLVALGWRTDAGRAELDSVIATLRLYHPAP